MFISPFEIWNATQVPLDTSKYIYIYLIYLIFISSCKKYYEHSWHEISWSTKLRFSHSCLYGPQQYRLFGFSEPNREAVFDHKDKSRVCSLKTILRLSIAGSYTFGFLVTCLYVHNVKSIAPARPKNLRQVIAMSNPTVAEDGTGTRCRRLIGCC